MKWIIPFVLLFLYACSAEKSTPAPEEKKQKKIEKSSGDIMEVHLPMKDTLELNTKALESGAQKKDGPIKVYYSDGKLKAQGTLIKGKKAGVWTSYYPNGAMWSRTAYFDGLATGASVTYYKNGSVQYTGDYVKGKRAGKWKFYDEYGTLEEEIEF
jgi:antitoxin component YwqK of YwqJK toxin-antitoxin module